MFSTLVVLRSLPSTWSLVFIMLEMEAVIWDHMHVNARGDIQMEML